SVPALLDVLPHADGQSDERRDHRRGGGDGLGGECPPPLRRLHLPFSHPRAGPLPTGIRHPAPPPGERIETVGSGAPPRRFVRPPALCRVPAPPPPEHTHRSQARAEEEHARRLRG